MEQYNNSSSAEWELNPLKRYTPESTKNHWTEGEHRSGPVNSRCITDGNHEIVRPKPRRFSNNVRNDNGDNNEKQSTFSTTDSFVTNGCKNSTKGRFEKSRNFSVVNNIKASTLGEQMEKVSLNSKDGPNNRCDISVTSFGNTPSNQDFVDRKNSGHESNKLSFSRHKHPNLLNIKQARSHHYGTYSSDDNRSSGHASMSDVSCTSPGSNLSAGPDLLIKSNRSNLCQNRWRNATTPAQKTEDDDNSVKSKQELQLTIRSHTSSSTYSSVSTYSESSEPALRRLVRHSSLETINTNVTNADEFVWIDSHNRLVELQHLPWTNHCILRVIQYGRCKTNATRVSVETIPRLSYLLQRALVRVSRETQRLSCSLGICTKHDVISSFRIILCPPLADSCTKAALSSAAMLAMSGEFSLKQSKSSRAGLQFNVGRFHRWMNDLNIAGFIHEYASVYLCAGIENLLEEIIQQCLPDDAEVCLTSTILEHAIANNADLWGLLQPYAHLNAGRIASGALVLPKWASVSSLSAPRNCHTNTKSLLMTTCVGSLQELEDLIETIQPRIPLCPKAVRTLYYFMRCSQLEHGVLGRVNAIQELYYERAYVVLPPLIEWLRVATAHGGHRFAAVIDKDDILQAARLLLPGIDYPIRSLGEAALRVKKNTGNDGDHAEASNQIQVELAFRLMLTGCPELIQQAIRFLPESTELNTLNSQGHTALMLATINNDYKAVQVLLDAGASVDIETPSTNSSEFAINGETQYWTALTYAAAKGHLKCAKILLEKEANVEGGASIGDEKCTLTPLQVACGTGNLNMVCLLCSHGANPFFSTQIRDSMCYSVATQKGCYSPISVTAAHGHRHVFQKLLEQPLVPSNNEVLSLEEMLAESTSKGINSQNNTSSKTQFNKTQIKALQEAMYHSAENNYLDITVEIRSMGIPWTLYCWMQSLGAAHEARLDCFIDQLLQDFLQVCQDDYSQQFVEECLPLLFNIFRYSKKEGTTLLLADIFSTCFGWEPIKAIEDYSNTRSCPSRIDPKYVNNPELSDITFKVDGRLFYAHKIVLVSASSRLKSMLNPKLCQNSLPTVQINDIRYHIFQIVMQYLYQGGCHSLDISEEDIPELMAAASFFQLDGLLAYCESRCAAMLALDNIVSMYIHAKVYNAAQLLEYCKGFLLQNMVALLTYDDSVKRLLFAKKHQKHDVLAGLLNTLQYRIKSRWPENNTTLQKIKS